MLTRLVIFILSERKKDLAYSLSLFNPARKPRALTLHLGSVHSSFFFPSVPDKIDQKRYRYLNINHNIFILLIIKKSKKQNTCQKKSG